MNADLAAQRVLIVVEDEEFDVLLLSQLLRKAGLQNPVHIARDGEEAIQLLSREFTSRDYQPPAAIFTDLSMPRCNGFELLAWIKTRTELHRVLTIVVSSSELEPDIARAFRAGCHGFSPEKPAAGGRSVGASPCSVCGPSLAGRESQ